jgi:hypothetical protein
MEKDIQMKYVAAGSAISNDAEATPEQPERGPGAGGSGATKSTVATGGLRYISDIAAVPRRNNRRRGKRQLLTVVDIDKRTVAYAVTKQMITDIESDLGGHDQLSAGEKQLAQHAAILAALMTDMEIKYLRGRTIDAGQYCVLANAQRRLFEAIGLRRRPRDVTPSVDEYVRSLK